MISIVVGGDFTVGDAAGLEEGCACGDDVIDGERDVQGYGMEILVIRELSFGIVVELDHHLAAFIEDEASVGRRAELAGDGHAQIFAIPVRSADGIGDVVGDVFKIHDVIVVEWR